MGTRRSPDAAQRWRESIAHLRTWRRGGQRAPHKPLLTLLLLQRAARGGGREVAFREIEAQLEQLLRDYGPPRKVQHPEFPFWHLQSDGFWVVRDRDALPPKSGGKSPSRSTLRAADARAEVPADLWQALRRSPRLRTELADRILDAYWPEGLWGELREALGLDSEDASTTPSMSKARDPAFRQSVLRAYEGRCAVCGYDGRLGGVEFALEAAHVRWHCENGPDSVDNSLALCSLHHKALDRGAIGLTEDHRILVSADLRGGEAVTTWLRRFSGRAILGPQSTYAPPLPKHVRWHTTEVFQGPARSVA